jgi:hypothetical protein
VQARRAPEIELAFTSPNSWDSSGTPLGCPSPTWAFRLGTTLEVYTHASVIAQREAVNLLENQLFPSVPKKAVESGRKEEVVSPIN